MQGWEFTMRVYDCTIKGVGMSGRPPVTGQKEWKNTGERNGGRMHKMVYAREVGTESDKWRFFCHGHPFMGSPGGNWHQRYRIDRKRFCQVN